MKLFLTTAAVLGLAASAQGTMRITEYQYTGLGGEFIEFTNVGNTSIDMTDWSFDDNSQTAGSFSLAPLGIVSPGQSVILAENLAVDFIANWSLVGVAVLGGNDQNLSRSDEMNIYDGAILVDRLTFGDQTFPGTIRTQDRSGNPLTAAALGANDITQWGLSSVGDGFGSYTALDGGVGNPGTSVYVPEPATLAIVLIGACLTQRRCRKQVQPQ